MAVSPAMRGLGIGRKLLEHAIAQARELGAKSLFLGSNSGAEECCASLRVGWLPACSAGEAALTGPQTGRLSFKLASTMDSVAEVEAAAEKLTQAAGMDEDEAFAW
jgi:predicted GNAT family acetyltransferase